MSGAAGDAGARKPEATPGGLPPAVFIGGYSRSGTTMLQGLVCSSAGTIGVTKEAAFLRGLLQAYGMSARRFHATADDYFDSPEQFADFNRRIIELYLRHVDARFGPGKTIVQKEPALTVHFPALARLVPDSKFVVMSRDLRDIVASQTERFRRRGDPVDLGREIDQFVSCYETIARHRDELAGRLLYVRYEGLVSAPDRTLAELGGFLGIALDPAAARRSWPVKRTANAAVATPLDGSPVSDARIGIYRSVLDPATIARIEELRPQIVRATGFDCFAADGPRDETRFWLTRPLD